MGADLSLVILVSPDALHPLWIPSCRCQPVGDNSAPAQRAAQRVLSPKDPGVRKLTGTLDKEHLHLKNNKLLEEVEGELYFIIFLILGLITSVLN